MNLYDQKFKVYNNLDQEAFQKVVSFETDLGYEVISTSVNKAQITVTYKRSKDLKHYFRLNDLEIKINELERLEQQTFRQLDDLYELKNTRHRTQKLMILLAFLFLLPFGIGEIWTMFLPDYSFTKNILDLLILITLNTLLILGFKLIVKKGYTNGYEDFIVKVNKYKFELREKVKKINKGEKEN